MDTINERKIRGSDSFQNIFDAYENGLQMKTDFMHSRISAGLNHGLAISYQNHHSVNEVNKKGKFQYIAPTLVGTGSNTYNQLGQLVDQSFKQSIEQVDSFEKIILYHNQEEYYPVQVCAGYSFSLILAIEGKNLQWFQNITQAKTEKQDKADAQSIQQEQFKELLSKSKIFFSGKLGIHEEENQEVERNTDKKGTLFRSGNRQKTRLDIKSSMKIEIDNKNEKQMFITNQGTLDYQTENEHLIEEQEYLLDNQDSQYSDDEIDGPQSLNRGQILAEAQKSYKFAIGDVIPINGGVSLREGFVIQISCGMNFCLALTYNYQVYAWGDNSYGNLGTSNLDFYPTPTLIEFEENKGNHSKIQSICCGQNHSAAVSVTGKLYTWGQGIHGQLGHKNIMNQSIPTMVKGELEEKKIILVSCGGSHTVCLTNEGYAYSWGNNRNGQLGQGDQEQRNSPLKLSRLQNYFILNVVCGMNTTFIFTQVGKIFACGSNQHNKLGLSNLNQLDNILIPADIDINFLKGIDKPKLKDVYIYQISSSAHFTYALSNKGLLTTWGLQVKGCLSRKIECFISEKMNNSDKDMTNMMIPCTSSSKINNNYPVIYQKFFFPIQNLNIFRASEKDFISNEIVDIQLGTFHTMTLTNAGEIYIWGSNQMGQHGCHSNEILKEYEDMNEKRMLLAVQDISSETLPTVVSFFNIKENRRITQIAAGSEYCMAIENKRLVYAWGRNSDGQLGIGKTQLYIDSPQMVLGLEGNLMKSIACGENHTLFLTDTGRVFSCGSSKDGKLGLGRRSNTQLQPQLIEGLTKVEAISCGQSHSMALAQDTFFQMEDEEEFSRQTNNKMVIYTWGNAWESKLGHGDRENLSEPTKIQSNYLFKCISAGFHHSAALTVDDNLVVWGPYRYFGFNKPDDHAKNKKVVSQSEYHEFQKPTLHPKITEQIRYVCLGDKTTFIVTKKDNKIYQYGLFESDIKELKKQGNSMEHILEKILPYKGGGGGDECELPVNEINNIVTSKDHVAILGKNKIYTWGFDNLTGRLGHGYVFQDRNIFIFQIELSNSKNSIDNMQSEDQNELDPRLKPFYDLKVKQEKPEYCNYINKYLNEQLKLFEKKQQQGKEEEGQQTSDYDSDDNEDEEKSVDGGEAKERTKTKKKTQLNTPSPQPVQQHHNHLTHHHNHKNHSSTPRKRESQIKNTIASTMSGHAFNSSSNIFEGRNDKKRLSAKKKNTSAFIQSQNKVPTEKMNNQQTYKEFFTNPKNIKSTYEKLITKDKPDLYTILIEPFGLINEERILFLYDKVSSIQGEIFQIYRRNQDFIKKNNLFKRATQSEILKRIASEPFNIKHEKSNNALKNQEYKLPFEMNKFYYVKLFTLLQLHPCYLIKIYQKGMDKDQFIQLVKETFGDLENDIRKQRLYVDICQKIFSIDLKANSSVLQDSRKPIILNTDKKTSLSYVFVKLFLYFYESLSENIKLNRILRLRIKKCFEDLIQSNSSKYPSLESMFVLDRKELENNSYYKTDEQFKEVLDRNQEAVKDYILAFFKDTDFLTSITGSGTSKTILGEKIRELIQFTFDTLQSKRPSENAENIQNYILGIIFTSMLENCQSLVSTSDAIMSNNYEWIIKCIKMYINLEDTDKKKQDINNYIEFIKSQDKERNRIYKKLVGKPLPKKSTALFDYISDIYKHSLEQKDNIILVSLSTIDKFTKFVNRVHIQYNPKEEEDMFLHWCRQLKVEQPNLVTSTIEKQFENQKVRLNLKTRQLLYSQTQVLKKCSDCDTILLSDFLRSNDRDIKEQFLMFNPSSLESCGIKTFQIINKVSFEEFINGKISIQQLSTKYIYKYTKEKFIPANVQIIKNFTKAFENAYELEYSNESQSDKLIIPSDLSKQVLKALKNRIDSQINQVVKYYNKMETLYRIYHSIRGSLDEFYQKITLKEAQQFKIITNCYYGLANRDLERAIESDPMAITSKISGSIHGKNLSTYLYENIDVFSNQDLTKIKTQFNSNQIKEHFIKLNMFGEYSLGSLKQKGVIKEIDNEVIKLLEEYLPKNRISKNKNLKKDVERCLFYIFNDFGNKHINDISVDVVYKGSEFSILTMLCGLKGSKELRIDAFKIEREVILQLRKQRIREDISKQQQKLGFTTFNKKGLLKLIEKMEDHYSVYEYIYSSNNCSV